ncbi:hypothetical protein OE88DRAFT_1648532 [Heliocybe sulcata]|uniref:Uncharacterized protein n=1 Tax=Heliocybe sulcata TaxID=5364 RepID=A0A5C3MRZ8_9AGAM|nr:hypothetical protein OE88DRAFT_1648532 [Heliocybe sulcata]
MAIFSTPVEPLCKPDSAPRRLPLPLPIAQTNLYFPPAGRQLHRSAGRTLGLNRINVLAEQHLDLTTSFAKQSANRVKTVYKHATREFPDLGKYKDCWPIKDYLIQHLQYTSRKSRVEAAVEAAAEAVMTRKRRATGKTKKVPITSHHVKHVLIIICVVCGRPAGDPDYNDNCSKLQSLSVDTLSRLPCASRSEFR